MRKLLIVIIALTICIAAVYADAYKDVNNMISKGYVKTDPEQIRALSSALTQDQKQSIYLWKRADLVGPVLMNSVLGFGSGSMRQGDHLHGVIFLCGDVLCTGLIAWNIIKNSGENIHNELYGDGGVSDDFTLAAVALGAAAALRVWQTIRAITYARQYNSKLSYALGLDSQVNAFILPDKNGPVVTFSAGISY